MSKKWLLIPIVLFFISCNNKQAPRTDDQLTDSISTTDSVTIAEEAPTYKFEEIELDEAYLENFSYKGIQLFEPRPYEENDFSKELFNIMEPFIGLFKNGKKYELKPCKITKTNLFESDCDGTLMIEPTLDVKGNCLYLIKGTHLKAKNVVDTIPAGVKVWLKKIYPFKFNKIEYTLKSEGDLVFRSDSRDGYYENIRNYKLYLTDGTKNQCIVEMKYFVETMTEILFIGDLDGDNKPDFIINSPDHYEAVRLMLFLSSYAEGDDLVKQVSITADSFSC